MPSRRMTLALLLLVPWIAAAGPGGRGKPRDPDALRAESLVAQGMPMLAVDAARKCLEARPGTLDCQVVLGRAAALAGRCEVALTALDAVRPSRRWSLTDALSEAACRQRVGDVAGARAAYQDAIGFSPTDVSIYFQRGLMEARVGDLRALDADLTRVRSLDADPSRGDTLEAWGWVERGDARADAAIYTFVSRTAVTADPEQRMQMAILQCQRLLDVGDPFAAETSAREDLRISRGQPRLVACRAEAVRRQGRALDAWVMVNYAWAAPRSQPIVDAIEVRTLVDLGRLDEARDLLATLPDPRDVEAIASAWYLHTARGDAAAASHASAAYAARGQAGLRPLTALSPVGGVW